MSLQFLHHFFGLQIPNVDHIILRSAHNPLAAGHRKVGENTVFLILVSRVRFEALALGVIPQFQRVVQRGRQDVFAVGTELDKGDRGIVVVYQGLQALARGCVPDPAEAVVTGGDDEAAVAVEMHGADGVAVGRQGFQAFAGAYVPDADTFVK